MSIERAANLLFAAVIIALVISFAFIGADLIGPRPPCNEGMSSRGCSEL